MNLPSRPVTRLIATLPLVLSVLLVACGGGQSPGNPTNPGGAVNSTTTSAAGMVTQVLPQPLSNPLGNNPPPAAVAQVVPAPVVLVPSSEHPAAPTEGPGIMRRMALAERAPRSSDVDLGPMDASVRSAGQAQSTDAVSPRKIGMSRGLAQTKSSANLRAKLQWSTQINGNRVAAITFASSGAESLRLGIQVQQLPPTTVFRFYAPQDTMAHEVPAKEVLELMRLNRASGDTSVDAKTYWSPIVPGEKITFEIQLPAGVSEDQLDLGVGQLSHFFESPSSHANASTAKAIGDGASCNLDVSCNSSVSALSKSVAKMVYTKGGSSFLCSGSLLTDRASSFTPYFLSANHCFSKQSEASTLQTFWFYTSSSCNSGQLSSSSVSRSGGATLLYASSLTDTLFLRLNSTPPAGASYAGWSVNAVDIGNTMTGVHHPVGDLQKVSFGTVRKFQNCGSSTVDSGLFSCSTSDVTQSSFFDINYTSGTTEGGSSGSPAFVTLNGSRYVVGQLYGGSASCTNQSGSNTYGRLDRAYNAALSAWLDAGTKAPLSVTKTGGGTGTVTSSPAGISCGSACTSAFDIATNVTLSAQPAAGSTFTGWSGACTGTGGCVVNLSSAKSVTADFFIPTISLNKALDNTELALSTSGNASFFGQTLNSTTGGSAAQAGKVLDSQSSTLTATVTGPGTLSFDWRVSSEADYDFLTVKLDGVNQNSITGESVWFNSVLTIPSGVHTVSWVYSKDFADAVGQDTGWVDNVQFVGSSAQANVIVNGGFENGSAGWVQSPTNIIDSNASSITPSIAGSARAAWICGYNDCADTLYQDFTIGSNVNSAILSFNYLVTTAETTTTRVYDSLTVEIRNAFTATRLLLITTLSNLSSGGTWKKITADLSAFAGKTVRLLFTGTGDFSNSTSFHIDNVSLQTATTAGAVLPQSGWWWNPEESGRGFAIERQGNKIFLAAFLYETSGINTWYVSALTQQPNGSYTGAMTRNAGGQTLTGTYKAPSSSLIVANATLSFTGTTVGTLSVVPTDLSASKVISIQRFPISSPGFSNPTSSFESGWWWNESQSGRGFFVEVQGSQAFVGSFMYDVSGQPTWYVSSANLFGAQFVTGTLSQYTGGQSLTGAFRSPTALASAGVMSFTFTSSATAVMVLPDGGTVALKRFIF